VNERTTQDTADDLASRIAQRSLAKRGANYATEVRRLLDAALEVIRERGTTSRPRVSDIVSAAGLSNEAFYRHFSSKDALVAALLEDGTARLRAYVDHQMSKESTAEAKVRRWVEGVLTQATGDTAETTRAVSWNAGSLGEDSVQGSLSASGPMASLLVKPFAELGSVDPEFDASLAAHAALGKLTDYLWQRVEPSRAEIDHISEFCLRTISLPE
jgi:AcrR family transcriptional regulator